jgi:hypothetical protein
MTHDIQMAPNTFLSTKMRRRIPLCGIEFDEDFLSTLVAKQLTKQRCKDNTAAKEVTLDRTHTSVTPWWIVQAVDKKKARLNCIQHLLNQMPYEEVPHQPIVLPARVRHEDYIRQQVPSEMFVPENY